MDSSTMTILPSGRAMRRAANGREIEEFVPYSRATAATLSRALSARIPGEVRFGDGDRALYATDGSNYRQVPIGVVVPRSIEDVVTTMALCREHGAPFLSRGGGTSLAGQCCNTAVVVDYSKYLNRILALDPERRIAAVEPGVVLDDLRDAAEAHHLTFGPDPSTHDHNTLGGMVGNNSCGVHSVMAGRTVDNVIALDVLTYDGLRLTVGPTSDEEFRAILAAGGRRAEIYGRLDALRQRYAAFIRKRYPRIPRRVSGYSLDELLPERGFNVARALVGSESTCVAVLKAELALVHSPPVRVLVVAGFPDIYTAGDAVPLFLRHKPLGLEGVDRRLVEYMRLKHQHEAALSSPQARLWEVRKAGLGATAFVPNHPDAWEGWEDSAVPPDHVGAYLRELDALFKRYGYESALYGKAELLGKMYGPELLEAFREFKRIWDPDGKMNPGKMVDPYPITSNLRVGPEYQPPALKTRFSFGAEGGGFDRAALRCVGIGTCRRHKTESGVMCPSYLATREEKHSTRGRGHLLFEMLHGGAIDGGWKSDAVEEALDLCLSCKGCKHDCPVNVDMATYKAEFRSHYYAGRLRPRAAYSMGLIYWWSRAASLMPGLANLIMRAPGLGALVKWAGGVAQERRMPRFAGETFRSWFDRHPPRNPRGPEVLLFPDTFNNFFRPETAIAAVHVLEAAGWRVTIPARPLCCGRPLYDWGMLDRADLLLRQLLDALAPALARGVPIVGLEPACISAFRDEVVALFAHDDRALRLKRQSFLLSEFLQERCPDLPLPRFPSGTKALVQMHCHEHALLKPEVEARVLKRMGLAAEVMATGCCGMAGSFGFEADKYRWSRKIAEHALLPRMQQASPGVAGGRQRLQLPRADRAGGRAGGAAHCRGRCSVPGVFRAAAAPEDRPP